MSDLAPHVIVIITFYLSMRQTSPHVTSCNLAPASLEDCYRRLDRVVDPGRSIGQEIEF